MLELYVTVGCPFCSELRDQLDWEGRPYIEYDIEADEAARRRFLALGGPHPIVPLLVEDGRPSALGWHGRGCAITPRTTDVLHTVDRVS